MELMAYKKLTTVLNSRRGHLCWVLIVEARLTITYLLNSWTCISELKNSSVFHSLWHWAFEGIGGGNITKGPFCTMKQFMGTANCAKFIWNGRWFTEKFSHLPGDPKIYVLHNIFWGLRLQVMSLKLKISSLKVRFMAGNH